ncbi:hypothetical protein NIIDMKKI_48920 [Mycobacterium kansasii]|uniref:Acyltransferase domain protein n=1 Tax=Mycobacterium kansasii TaxID=1768 RepID=A0A7G1IF18_MYCKA|nr:hypothetical protein NIIDMKKI_48920 [Mycobacterium kansasii]
MGDKRDKQDGGLSGWVAKRAGKWDLDGQDETTLHRHKFVWNLLVDYWFRMEIDGWDNIPEPPVLLVGIHSGAPFVWDAWTVGLQWWRRFGPERPLHGTAHDALMAIPGIGRYFRSMGSFRRPRMPSRRHWPRGVTWRCGPAVRWIRCGPGPSVTGQTSPGGKAS